MESGPHDYKTPSKGRQMDMGEPRMEPGTLKSVGGPTSPLRKNATQFDIYSAKADAKGSTPFPQGPPMTDKTNIHSGQLPTGNMGSYTGPLCQSDEKELV